MAPPALGEFEIIARYFAPLAAREAGALGLLDDAAVVALPPGRSVVVSTDALVASVHFLSDEAADDVAAKTLAVGFSDLAAMGADAVGYTLSLALPRAWSVGCLERWLAGFAAGLGGEQQRLGVSLLGGDTVATPGPLALSITVLGSVESGRALTRAGARPGDRVFVSGTIGDAALGLAVLTGRIEASGPAARDALIRRYRRPAARLALGRRLVGVASAACDVSDGLVADLGHICRASGVSATLEAAAIPLSDAAAAVLAGGSGQLADVVEGGDDYELVFTVPAEHVARLRDIARAADTPVAAIGRIDPEPAEPAAVVRLVDAAGRPMETRRGGYRHF
ncbi:MAG: thiamine-phosphate kinase [Rhodospirillales bacterium]|nr:MAG: thiamine-phosphate kinase [Rhodospirillales bacterium]